MFARRGKFCTLLAFAQTATINKVIQFYLLLESFSLAVATDNGRNARKLTAGLTGTLGAQDYMGNTFE